MYLVMDPKTMLFVIDALLQNEAKRCLEGTYTPENEATVRALMNQRQYWQAKLNTGNGLAL